LGVAACVGCFLLGTVVTARDGMHHDDRICRLAFMITYLLIDQYDVCRQPGEVARAVSSVSARKCIQCDTPRAVGKIYTAFSRKRKGVARVLAPLGLVHVGKGVLYVLDSRHRPAQGGLDSLVLHRVDERQHAGSRAELVARFVPLHLPQLADDVDVMRDALVSRRLLWKQVQHHPETRRHDRRTTQAARLVCHGDNALGRRQLLIRARRPLLDDLHFAVPQRLFVSGFVSATAIDMPLSSPTSLSCGRRMAAPKTMLPGAQPTRIWERA
jgi:hypothetical protein